MNFDNIYSLLLWFFRKKWLKPPKQPGNHDFAAVMGGIRYGIEDVWNTATKIKMVLSQVSPRDVEILRQLFTSMTPEEVGDKMGITDRRVRQIRRKMVEVLRGKCQDAGLLGGKIIYTPIKSRDQIWVRKLKSQNSRGLH